MFSERTQAILLCAAVAAAIVAGFVLYNWQKGQDEIARQLWLKTVEGSPVATATCARDLDTWETGDAQVISRKYGPRTENVLANCRLLLEQRGLR